jgi:hypothetical protein
VLTRQRQHVILCEVERSGGARVCELVDILAVCDMTVRRDIEAPAANEAANEVVVKVHGDAAAVGGRTADEPGFHVKSEMPAQVRHRRRCGWTDLPRNIDRHLGRHHDARRGTRAAQRPQPDRGDELARVADVLHNPQRDDPTAVLTTANLIEAATNRASSRPLDKSSWWPPTARRA